MIGIHGTRTGKIELCGDWLILKAFVIAIQMGSEEWIGYWIVIRTLVSSVRHTCSHRDAPLPRLASTMTIFTFSVTFATAFIFFVAVTSVFAWS